MLNFHPFVKVWGCGQWRGLLHAQGQKNMTMFFKTGGIKNNFIPDKSKKIFSYQKS